VTAVAGAAAAAGAGAAAATGAGSPFGDLGFSDFFPGADGGGGGLIPGLGGPEEREEEAP
jgi:hypothetical protein